jgi:hypothetical protein
VERQPAYVNGQQAQPAEAHGTVPEIEPEGQVLPVCSTDSLHQSALQQEHGVGATWLTIMTSAMPSPPPQNQKVVLVPLHLVFEHLYGSGLEAVQDPHG